MRIRSLFGAVVGFGVLALSAASMTTVSAQSVAPSATPAFCFPNGPVPVGYALIEGDAMNNVLVGGPGPDLIRGFAGDDVLFGNGGNDLLCGGPGVDRLFGGAGNDRLWGGEGDDWLFGEANVDTLNGGAAFDTCNGGPAVDFADVSCENQIAI